MRALVVYYSWTGNTAKVAQAVAAGLGCDIEALRERRPRVGGLGRLRCMLDGVLRLKPRLQPLLHSLADYELVILGCPIWSREMASPMRSFLDDHKVEFRTTALFCTEGGVGGELVLETMSRATGAPDVARCVITQGQLATDEWRKPLADFLGSLKARTSVGPAEARAMAPGGARSEPTQAMG